MDAAAGVMHAASISQCLVAHPGLDGDSMPLDIAVAEPILQQQLEIGRISYDTDDSNAAQQPGGTYRGSALLGRKHAADRRPLRFWQPFNDWWRAELDRLGRRPTSNEIGDWYIQAAGGVWGECKPTLQETRVHAKCLRSLPLVRDYFRNYRAKKRGHKGEGGDGDDDADTEDGTDNGCGGRARRVRTETASEDLAVSAFSGMAQLGPAEMTQLQSAGMMLPQQFWAGALAGLEGHDADDYTRAIMMQQHLQAAMLQQQMAAAAVAAQQFTGQQFGVFSAHDDDDDEEDTDPGDGHAAAAAHEPADAGTEVVSGLAPSDPPAALLSAAAPPAAEGAQAVPVMHPCELAPLIAAASGPEATVGIIDGMLVDHDPSEVDVVGGAAVNRSMDGYALQGQQLQEADMLVAGLQPHEVAVHMQAGHQQPRALHSAAAVLASATTAAATGGEADATAAMHRYVPAAPTTAALKAEACCEALLQQQFGIGVVGGPGACQAFVGIESSCTGVPRGEAPTPAPVQPTQQRHTAAEKGVHLPGVGRPGTYAGASAGADTGSLQPASHDSIGVVAEQPNTTATARPQALALHAVAQQQMQPDEPSRAPEHEEVLLLPAEQLDSINQEMLVAHIKAVQEELISKRELLKRSFDQLRRTQERLGRRERKLAKEQQKCRHYQQALAVWQASMMPMADPAAQELYQAQIQVTMAAQAAAVQQVAAAGAAGAKQQ